MATQYHNHQPPMLGKIGNLETRLACSEEEIRAAQQLRYRVFYEERGQNLPHSSSDSGLPVDADAFDSHCDHLIVLDNDKIVATYRLLTEKRAETGIGFYSQQEFDLRRLRTANTGKNLLELGRSCVHKEYRNKRTMELLWAGTWAYALAHNIDIMFGCASFSGTDATVHHRSLSWLSQNAQLDRTENCAGLTGTCLDLNSLPRTDGKDDAKRAFVGLPPILKGYLRLGAKIASDAVIDHEFGTIDVLVVLKVADINPKYVAHYGADASRFVA